MTREELIAELRPPRSERPDFNPPGQGARVLAWAPSRCEYCWRRGVAGAAECVGCGAASTRAAVQLVGEDEPRLSPNVELKW